MKKNKYSLSLSLKFLCRVVLMTVFGTSFLCFSVKGDPVEPQRVTLNLREVSLSVLFQEIKNQTSFKFFYNDTQEKDMGKITVNVKNETVERVLERVFQGKGYTYKVSGEQIIVVKREEKTKSVEEVVIEGTVVETGKDSMPIIGATVVLHGTTTGVVTDVNGKFRLVVPLDDEIYIEISFLGMKKQVHKVVGLPNPKPMRIVMQPETVGVDEVIVTGYANIRKESFTGAATTVTKDEILKISPRNVIDVLQVFDPSLRMVKNNEMGSDPNTLPEFYIRGRTGMDGVTQLDRLEAQQGGNMSKFSLTTNPNLPVFILDGYEVEVQKIYDMDPNRIASITILKDAAATAMYGSRASNGVVVIETVTPELGKLQVSYTFNASLTVPDLSDYNLMNAEEKLQAELLSGLYDLSTANGIVSYAKKKNYIAKGVDTDWMSQPLQNQFNHSHSLYVSGGTEGFRFGADVSYSREGGVMKESYRNRMSVGVYVDYRVGKLQIRNNVSYDLAKSSDSPYGSFGDYTKQQPYYAIHDDNGKLKEMLDIGIPNPLYEASLGSFQRGESSTLTNNLSFYWFISDHLQLQSQFSVTKSDSEDKDFTDPLSSNYSVSQTNPFQRGDLQVNGTDNFNWNLNAFLAYNNSIGQHYMNLSLGVNAQESQSSNLSSHYRGFPSAALNTVGHAKEIVEKPSGADNKTRLLGIFLSGNYSWNNIFLADVSVRFDGSSEFGSESQWGSFWSLGGGVNLHNFKFMQAIPWINQLKIRGTYGSTGKVNYPPYAARDMYTIMFDNWYNTGIGATMQGIGNENLKWEKTNTTNIGFDLSFFQSKYNLTFSWYNRQTVDMITDVTIPSSAGFTSYKDNMGETRNRGYELSFNATIINGKDFGLNAFINFAHNEGKLMKISEALRAYNERVDDYLTLQYTQYNNAVEQSKPFLKYEEGGSLTAIYGMKSLGINPADGEELFLDRSGNVIGQWLSSQQQIIGNTEPKGQGAFGINIRWKRLTLYTSCMYEFGGQAYNSTLLSKVECVDLGSSNADKRVLTQRWQKPGDVTPLKNIANRNQATQSTSRFVQDNNEFSINSISLSYDFNPEWVKRIGLDVLRIQASTNDLVTFSSIKQERGLDYPFARTFNLGLSVSF
jgi:TonB-linked SusC/RagA family outer membrane protein